MKVHIISDMEGVAGIVKWQQTSGGDPMYEEGRRLYTEEINAAVRGAKAAGATEIVVMDCHGAGGGWSFNSLIPELLDPACEFVVQEEWTSYTGFLEAGCDAALFVGMHAMNGDEYGVLNHTVSGQEWQNLSFNGTLVGETGINAALCGTWGAPCCSSPATARRAKKARAARQRPDDGRGEGRPRPLQRASVPAVKARELIEDGAKRALRISAPCSRTTPAARARSRSSTRSRRRSTSCVACPASRSWTPPHPLDGGHVVGGLAAVLLLRLRRPRRRRRAPARHDPSPGQGSCPFGRSFPTWLELRAADRTCSTVPASHGPSPGLGSGPVEPGG